MANYLAKGSIFPTQLMPEMVQLVKGHSSLAQLSGQAPIAFNGNTEVTFSLDKEVDVVAENGAKTVGGGTVVAKTITPVKIEYGLRVSDEFVYASDEVQLDYLRTFAEGFARKLARGIDIMAMHGFNPRTKATSTVIGDNHFDKAVTNVVTEATGVTADANMESAVALILANDGDVNGAAISPTMRSSLASLTTTDGAKMYPELGWGAQPKTVNGLNVDFNSTVSFNSSKDRAIVGDFANMFKWGYGKEIGIEVIQYGNPDNDSTLGDLKGHNQVYIRGEAYVGWAILDPTAFAIIKAA